MSLPDVNWRYVGRSYVGNGTINPNTILDSIYSLGSSSTYYDGTTRVQGSGSAGTWDRYQNNGITEAVYLTPPSGNQKIIIAGSSGTPATLPIMNSTLGSNSGYVTNKLFVNITKNPGNFIAWNSGNPFTSGNAFGYVPFLGSRSVASTGITSFPGYLYSYLFESKESIMVVLIENGSDNVSSYSNGFIAGAIVDPESTNVLDAESDGRLYGILSTGHFTSGGVGSWGAGTNVPLWTTGWHNTVNAGFSFLYGYINNSSYCSGRGGVFVPGSSTVRPIAASHALSTVVGGATANSLISPSDRYIRFPILMKGAVSPDNIVYGSLRNIKYCNGGLIGQIHTDGANTVGYVVGCSNNPVYISDAILLEH